jgi:hypothetical protein
MAAPARGAIKMERLKIINKTFFKLGQDPLQSLNSAEKRMVAALMNFEDTRDELQSTYPWKFCTARARLTAFTAPDENGQPVPVSPEFGYKYKFLLPRNYLRLYECEQLGYTWNSPQEALPPMEGDFLLSNNAGPLNIIYIRKITEEHKWPPAFREAYACLLAEKLCFAVQQSPAYKLILKNDFKEAIAGARRIDAMQSAAIKLPITESEKARLEL